MPNAGTCGEGSPLEEAFQPMLEWTMDVDVLIVGGGPAGLSAALILARCHRKVFLCDDQKQRNRASDAIRGLLGSNGRSPAQFLQNAREELARHTSVSIIRTRVMEIEPCEGGFS